MIRVGLKVAFWVIGLVLVFAIVANLWVVLSTQSQIRSIDEVKDMPAVLLLGTGYNTTQGQSNPFFTSRIATGTQLYNKKLISRFILSGSATEYYNEPNAMARDLVINGIPESILTRDSLGVRTLSSIIRCKEVYHQERVVIVTQRFHAYRALFISNYYDLEAIAVVTNGVEASGKVGVVMREFFARPLAVIDLYILNRRP